MIRTGKARSCYDGGVPLQHVYAFTSRHSTSLGTRLLDLLFWDGQAASNSAGIALVAFRVSEISSLGVELSQTSVGLLRGPRRFS